MNPSPFESINCHIKHRSKASTLNNTSRSLMLITEGTNSRIAGIDNSAKQELQLTVLSSKSTVRSLYHRKCVYLLNRFFDSQKSQCCVMHAPAEWIVWNFQYEPPYFKDDELNLAYLFPVFANVYHVKVTTFGKQRFFKCDCLHYERCGIPCSHILKITVEIEEMMIKIQHLKVNQAHYGNMDSNLSSKLMQGSSLQTSYEDMGMPLLDKCLDKALIPRESL
jgi:hypothetical protein